jgi:tetratricopeptide (TPR) repeat protein
MPLALELAAARLRSMSLMQLHERLEHRFGLLTGGSRMALPRQQTLRALVDWSYDLLSEPERALFRRASVFVDGFDLEAAEGVCGLGEIPAWKIADLLASLVDKSLVVAEPHGPTLRYRLLETLRQYGAECLAEADAGGADGSEAARVAAAHGDYYLTFAEQAASRLEGRSPRVWFERLNREEMNLRSAIECSLATGEIDRVLRQFWSLQDYWVDSQEPLQALVLLERALNQVGPDITAVRRAEALLCKGELLYQVDRRLRLDAVLAALTIAREVGDEGLEADALSRYSRCLLDNGRGLEARDAGGEAVVLARQIGDPLALSKVLGRYAQVVAGVDALEAEGYYSESLALTGQTGYEALAAILHNSYAMLLIDQGNIADARRHIEIALDLEGEKLTNRSAPQYSGLALVLLQEGDIHRAAFHHADILRMVRLNGNAWMVAYAVLGLACCATRSEAPELAATLHGGADSLLSPVAEKWDVLEENIRAQDIAVLQDRLSDEFERRYAEGLAMAHPEIVRLALTAH